MAQEFNSVTDIAGMDDDAIASLSVEDYEAATASMDQEEPEQDLEPTEQDDGNTDLEPEDEVEEDDSDWFDAPDEDVEDSEQQEETEAYESDEEEPDAEETEDGDADDDNPETDEEADEASEEEEDGSEEAELSEAEAELEKLLAPFKAGGLEMQVKSVDEAITLMQKGVDYGRKMQQLKPHLKRIRMLEKAELLDDDKLNLLIDASKGNSGAISKLMQEHEIDALDVDEEKANTYNPNTYTVDDKELELSEVIETLRGTDSYTKTVEIVGNKWDQRSRQAIQENPELLTTINDHVAQGYFDKISAEVDKAKLLGNVPTGLSDLEAYGHVLTQLQAAEEAANKAAKAPANVVKKAQTKPKADPELRSRKRSSMPSKGKPRKAAKPASDYDILNMSDEEFMNLAGNV